jgi:hypothetical protein
VDGLVKGGRAEGARLAARAGRAWAAHVVALGAVGRRNELAERERKMRDVIPDAHGTQALSPRMSLPIADMLMRPVVNSP